MDLEELIRYRVETLPHLERHYDRAVRTTGQRSIRFPRPYEDTSTMAAAAALRLIRNGRLNNLSKLRYLVTGTETPMDYSKPVSAYVQGMLGKAGIQMPSGLASFQVQHACAGGTLGLMSAAALLAAAPQDGESALVIAADIARYEGKSTAEVTQGAGAVALLVEKEPALVELDIANMGYSSEDVDDFFRPLGSVTAKVKGQYSMQCYRNNLERALADFAARQGTILAAVLQRTDYFVLHAPFRNMPAIALEKMMETHLGLSASEVRRQLHERGMYESLEVVADIGNTYTASLYITLASLLQNRFRSERSAIVGKSVLLCSYGSGNTMIVMSGRIAAKAPEVISSWTSPLLERGGRSDVRDYELWMNIPYLGLGQRVVDDRFEIPGGSFYLSHLREDGYREYDYAKVPTVWSMASAVFPKSGQRELAADRLLAV